MGAGSVGSDVSASSRRLPRPPPRTRWASGWERRDLATLQLYRIVTSEEDADAIRKRLPRAKDHQVSIGVERIRTRAQYATVAFALAEFDARGKLVSS